MKKDKGSLYLDSVLGVIILNILICYFTNFFISNIRLNKTIFKKNLAIEDLSNLSEELKSGKYKSLLKELLDKSKIQLRTKSRLDLEISLISRIKDLYIIELMLEYDDSKSIKWVIPIVEEI